MKQYSPIETTEFPTGVISDYYLKRVIKRNKQPVFDIHNKYFDFIKVLRSTTIVIPWLIRIEGNYYVASFHFLRNIDYAISFFHSDAKGNHDILNPICIYRSYVDLEAACDRFVTEYIAMQINNKNEKFTNIINNIENEENN